MEGFSDILIVIGVCFLAYLVWKFLTPQIQQAKTQPLERYYNKILEISSPYNSLDVVKRMQANALTLLCNYAKRVKMNNFDDFLTHLYKNRNDYHTLEWYACLYIYSYNFYPGLHITPPREESNAIHALKDHCEAKIKECREIIPSEFFYEFGLDPKEFD